MHSDRWPNIDVLLAGDEGKVKEENGTANTEPTEVSKDGEEKPSTEEQTKEETKEEKKEEIEVVSCNLS